MSLERWAHTAPFKLKVFELSEKNGKHSAARMLKVDGMKVQELYLYFVQVPGVLLLGREHLLEGIQYSV